MKIDTSKYSTTKVKFQKEKKTSFWNRDISFSKKKMSDKLKERFYGDFLTLLKAGVDVQNSLEILSEDNKNKHYLSVVTSIKTKLISGQSLSQSMHSIGDFSKYEINSIKIGEETGNLTIILKQLSDFFYGKFKLRKLLLKAISYPILVLVATFVVLMFMLNFIVPKFKDVFSKFDKDLPELTLRIVDASNFLQNNLFYILIVTILTSLWFYSQRNKTWFRSFFSNLTLRIPFVGNLIKQIYLVRFYQFMYLLTNAKHNLVESVGLVRDVIGYYPIEKALEKTEEDLRKGEFLHHSLKRSDFFDTRLITLIKVAENRLYFEGFTFEKVTDKEVNIYGLIHQDGKEEEIKFNYIKQ